MSLGPSTIGPTSREVFPQNEHVVTRRPRKPPSSPSLPPPPPPPPPWEDSCSSWNWPDGGGVPSALDRMSGISVRGLDCSSRRFKGVLLSSSSRVNQGVLAAIVPCGEVPQLSYPDIERGSSQQDLLNLDQMMHLLGAAFRSYAGSGVLQPVQTPHRRVVQYHASP